MRQIPRSKQGRKRSPRNFVREQMKMQRIRAIKQNGLHHGYEGKGWIVSGAHHGHMYRVAFHLENVETSLVGVENNLWKTTPRWGERKFHEHTSKLFLNCDRSTERSSICEFSLCVCTGDDRHFPPTFDLLTSADGTENNILDVQSDNERSIMMRQLPFSKRYK